MNVLNDISLADNHAAFKNTEFFKSIVSADRISGATHTFYRYPARFSPTFVQEAIKQFSEPGDTILDPFMGGGTTIVEGMRLGRNTIGSDINQLSCFVTTAKTNKLYKQDKEEIAAWLESLNRKFPDIENERKKYLVNLDDSDIKPIRIEIENYINSLDLLHSKKAKIFLRCALLNVSQWALDCRTDTPSVEIFKEKYTSVIQEMILSNEQYFQEVKSAGEGTKRKILNCKAEELEKHISKDCHPIKLIITSPPYPGVHVLYHRWQIKGRKETAIPYYIANCNDGMPGSYYTFGSRKQKGCTAYFENLRKSYSVLGKISDSETTVIQMVAFAEPTWQLPEYLNAMRDSGFKEVSFDDEAQIKRVWRNVPSRKWYARSKGSTPSSKEVVLIHKKA